MANCEKLDRMFVFDGNPHRDDDEGVKRTDFLKRVLKFVERQNAKFPEPRPAFVADLHKDPVEVLATYPANTSAAAEMLTSWQTDADELGLQIK